jgi:alpha-ketoglutarate-dependent taurine dioxygenase
LIAPKAIVDTKRDLSPALTRSPFLLENQDEYCDWRRHKLVACQSLNALKVFQLDDQRLMPAESMEALRQQLQAFNFILFDAGDGFTQQDFLRLNQQMGLTRCEPDEEAAGETVTLLKQVAATDQRARYIPFSNRALNWHTDGYYNSPQYRLNAFALFCKHQSKAGGENFLLDHELLYIKIRDAAPDLIQALMNNGVMRVPENIRGGKMVREEIPGPVYSVDSIDGFLNMRFSSRPKHIIWKQDKTSQAALKMITDILTDREIAFELKLNAGEGIICNNILHGRRAFDDTDSSNPRLYYRTRYYDRIRVVN